MVVEVRRGVASGPLPADSVSGRTVVSVDMAILLELGGITDEPRHGAHLSAAPRADAEIGPIAPARIDRNRRRPHPLAVARESSRARTVSRPISLERSPWACPRRGRVPIACSPGVGVP